MAGTQFKSSRNDVTGALATVVHSRHAHEHRGDHSHVDESSCGRRDSAVPGLNHGCAPGLEQKQCFESADWNGIRGGLRSGGTVGSTNPVLAIVANGSAVLT